MKETKLVIITGMSGAGKTTVLKSLEDVGYFCIDNLPIEFLLDFSKMTMDNKERSKTAIGIDIRSGTGLEVLSKILPEVKRLGSKILFLEASDSVLIRRYKETRRTHPLSMPKRLETMIEIERNKLSFLKKEADYIIDTTRLLTRELKLEVYKLFVNKEKYRGFVTTILSFGYKYGIPSDADLVFDVRFLPNPFYVKELREKTGNDREVYEYVMSNESSEKFMKKLTDLLDFLLPNYILEGKNQLVIGIGCTGGKHRSVSIANALVEWFNTTDYKVRVEHREI